MLAKSPGLSEDSEFQMLKCREFDAANSRQKKSTKKLPKGWSEFKRKFIESVSRMKKECSQFSNSPLAARNEHLAAKMSKTTIESNSKISRVRKARQMPTKCKPSKTRKSSQSSERRKVHSEPTYLKLKTQETRISEK